jgi:lipoprotein-releasing system ATP-binding protein
MNDQTAVSDNTVVSSDVRPVLALMGITRTFHQGREDLEVLKSVDLEIFPGEVVGLVGPSGAGKSTLLHIAGLLETADSGETYIAGEQCSQMNDDQRTRVRRESLGFVYQYHHLLPEFTALENVTIPQIISGTHRKEAKHRAKELLDWMGLKARETHRPARLSGGEQQRVAIARAIAASPKLLLADEPTGNLDPHTADDVFEVLLKLARGAGLAALIATHNPNLAAKMDRVVKLEDGQLIAA